MDANNPSTGQPALHLMSGGAALGLFTPLRDLLTTLAGGEIHTHFDAVGAVRDALLAGAPCDVYISTLAQLQTLGGSGWIDADTIQPLGAVATGLAWPEGAGSAPAEPTDGDALLQVLEKASAWYSPNTQKATAGIHFRAVLERLGLWPLAEQRLREFPNGAAAMAALASAWAAGERGAIGCTQVTEILFAPGVELFGLLPAGFDLHTVYAAAMTRQTRRPQAAQAVIGALVAKEQAGLRERAGFRAA